MIDWIRKFGLQACDLKTMLWNVSVLLRVLTVNIDSKYKRRIPIIFYIVTYICAACYFYVYLFSMVWFVFYRCMETGDLVAATVVLSLGISSEIGNLKLVYMVAQLNKIKQIADDYLEFDDKVVKDSRFCANLLLALRDIKKRAVVYWMVLVGNGVIYLAKPLFLRGKQLPENHYVIYGLEPMFESPTYELAYFMMVAGISFVCYVPANVTAYLIVIVGYTEAHILALAKEVLNLLPDAIELANIDTTVKNINNITEYDRKKLNENIKKLLKNIVQKHAGIINLFLSVENMFRGAIAMGFVLLIMGILSELLGGLENTYLQMPFMLMQVAMDCFIGQRLIDACVLFEQAVYDIKWENFDAVNRKMVLLILQSSQKTLCLSAGGVSTLSFECLMSLTKAIYSAYNALRVTMNKSQNKE